jgi:hypothetical protein
VREFEEFARKIIDVVVKGGWYDSDDQKETASLWAKELEVLKRSHSHSASDLASALAAIGHLREACADGRPEILEHALAATSGYKALV